MIDLSCLSCIHTVPPHQPVVLPMPLLSWPAPPCPWNAQAASRLPLRPCLSWRSRMSWPTCTVPPSSIPSSSSSKPKSGPSRHVCSVNLKGSGSYQPCFLRILPWPPHILLGCLGHRGGRPAELGGSDVNWGVGGTGLPASSSGPGCQWSGQRSHKGPWCLYRALLPQCPIVLGWALSHAWDGGTVSSV